MTGLTVITAAASRNALRSKIARTAFAHAGCLDDPSVSRNSSWLSYTTRPPRRAASLAASTPVRS
jgi:hypothetical protein